MSHGGALLNGNYNYEHKRVLHKHKINQTAHIYLDQKIFTVPDGRDRMEEVGRGRVGGAIPDGWEADEKVGRDKA